MSGDELTGPVRELYERWRRCWQELDGSAMVELFTDEPGRLIYQAEEYFKPFLTKEKLERYWQSVPRDVIERIEQWDEVSLSSLTAGTVTVIEVHTAARLRLHSMPQTLDGVLRSTLVVETSGSDARLLHYHESRHLKLGFTVS